VCIDERSVCDGGTANAPGGRVEERDGVAVENASGDQDEKARNSRNIGSFKNRGIARVFNTLRWN
jgi:hypothetical protein